MSKFGHKLAIPALAQSAGARILAWNIFGGNSAAPTMVSVLMSGDDNVRDHYS